MTTGLQIVVVNHRTAEDLSVFLDTLAEYPPTVPFSVSIANVAPEFDDVEVVEQWRERSGIEATHRVFEENVGYAVACNDLAAIGDESVIALFNADVRLTAGALDACFGALTAQPDWAILGPRQINDEGRLVHAGIFGPDWAPKHRGWREMSGYQDIRDDAYSVAGSAYFVKRSVWNELTACPLYQKAAPGAVGAFLPTRLWYEETFCSVHARAHSENKVVYFGEVTIVHRLSRSIKKNGVPNTLLGESQAFFRSACDIHGLDHD